MLDPSGVVKGWAVQRAARAFDALADTDVCLSAGGDMVCRVRVRDRAARARRARRRERAHLRPPTTGSYNMTSWS